jgi:hypothetical protein
MAKAQGGIGALVASAAFVAFAVSSPGAPRKHASDDKERASVVRESLPAASARAPPAPSKECATLLRSLQKIERSHDSDQHCEGAFAAFLERNALCAHPPDDAPVQALVATIADPLDSRLPAMFDQTLAAFVLAGEKRGAFSDYWLPWIADRQPPADKDKEASAGRIGRCHERWPGVVVFARDDRVDRQRKTVLLLAGELPTAGVRKPALRRAVRMARKLTAPGPVAVVGPQFSGSAASLRAALKSEIETDAERLHVRVISGSATRLLNQSLLTATFPKGSITFEATVVPDSVKESRFFEYLVDKSFAIHRPPSTNGMCLLSNVAVLKEADSAYAQSFSVSDDSSAGSVPDGRATAGQLSTSPSCRNYTPKYFIDFPIHIADVRSAWEGEASLREKESADSVVAAPITSVPIDMRERKDTMDDLPAFSKLTASSDQRALESALDVLQENRVDVVGIVATDTRDKLFLAEAVHRSAPDAQLFLFESDELLTHPDHGEALRGALVVGTYPLVNANQSWAARAGQDEAQERMQFGINAGEGNYNAALAALGVSHLYEYHWPLVPGFDDQLHDQGKPPIWVTAIGGGAFWPVAALSYKPTQAKGASTPYVLEDKSPHEPSTLRRTVFEPSRSDSAAFVLLCGVIVAIGVVFLRMMRSGSARHLPAALRPLLLVARPVRSIAVWTPRALARRHWLSVATTLAAFLLFLLLAIWLGALSAVPVAAKLARNAAGTGLPLSLIFSWQAARLFAAIVACTTCTLVVGAVVGKEWLAAADPDVQRLPLRTGLWYGLGTLVGPVTALATMTVILPATESRPPPPGSARQPGTVAARLRWGLFVIILTSAWGIVLLRLASRVYIAPSADLAQVFRYWRSVHLSSELSPVVPTLALFAVLLLVFANVLRILDLDQGLACSPTLRVDPDDCARRASERLSEPLHLGSGFAAFTVASDDLGTRLQTVMTAVLFLLPAVWVLANVRGRLDHGWGTWVLPEAVAFAVLFCLTGVWHLWRLWSTLGAWLEQLAREPIREAFKRVSPVAQRFVGRGSAMVPPDEKAVARLDEMLDVAVAKAGASEGGNNWEKVVITLEAQWKANEAQLKANAPAAEGTLRALLEDAAALRFSFQIAYAVARLRGIWFCVTCSALLFVFSMSSYPVHPHKALLVLGWAVTAAVVAATVTLFVRMNRNEVLSLLADTDPNHVTWDSDLVLKIVWFAAVPIFGLVTAQFPEVAHVVSRLLDPVLRGH